jgi:signal transduction histidine kinase
MVAHEFNNILTPIVNYAQLARGNPALLAKAVSQAADGGRRASAICEAILHLARDDSARKESICLRELVQDSLAAMARDPDRDAIELIVDVPEGLVVAARRAELQQVLLNLLLNARQAVLRRSAPRRIEVRAESCPHAVRLSVRDNGVGIPRKDLPRVFQPFYTTRRDGNGSGLGLAFCRRVVRSLGGRISVQSREGEGAAFTVVIPAAAAPAAAAATRAAG